MTHLCQRMIEDMRVRNLSPNTQRLYVDRVAKFAQYFGKSPELLGPEDVRTYQVYLIHQKRASSSMLQQTVCALRFLYRNTLWKGVLGSSRQVAHIPKSEFPVLLGELEILKARLWVRLTEWEEIKPVVVLAKTVVKQPQNTNNRSDPIPCNQTPGPERRILRAKEVIKLTGLSRSTIWRLQRQGKFPRSRRIGDVAVGWLDAEVLAWINGRFKDEE